MCLNPSRKLRRFTHTIIPADDFTRRMGLPVTVCICEACHKVAVAPAQYTPGCKCDECRKVHALLNQLLQAHIEPSVRLFDAPDATWYEGNGKLYREKRNA